MCRYGIFTVYAARKNDAPEAIKYRSKMQQDSLAAERLFFGFAEIFVYFGKSALCRFFI